MGRLRSTIRAYALEEREPAEVLDLADRKLQHFEPSEIATVACATMSPPYRELCLATAGHPPAVVAMPGCEAEFVETERSLPLGAPSTFARSATTVPMAPGGIMFLYTDGLIERRYESLDIGLERLRAVVKADRAEIVCRTVLDTLIGDSVPDDDVAMVTIRARPDR
jgi:serine phosphatase RsbU (regulator of sigma subunit)